MQNDALSKTPTDALAELRGEIDRIDLAMHRLLMQRGEIIDRLIEVKRTQCAGPGGGCAFRPDREAQMMRALVERHHGLLPLDAVEGIWRVIVSTFTFVQAPIPSTPTIPAATRRCATARAFISASPCLMSRITARSRSSTP